MKKIFQKAALTAGMGAAIVTMIAVPANAASASAASKYFKASGVTCRSYVRIDDWTRGKIRVTSTVACTRRALQYYVTAMIGRGSKMLTSHRSHCTYINTCSSYAYIKNPSGRQSWRGTTSSLVNDSFLTLPAKAYITS
jgi:hypothetical protein